MPGLLVISQAPNGVFDRILELYFTSVSFYLNNMGSHAIFSQMYSNLAIFFPDKQPIILQPEDG